MVILWFSYAFPPIIHRSVLTGTLPGRGPFGLQPAAWRRGQGPCKARPGLSMEKLGKIMENHVSTMENMGLYGIIWDYMGFAWDYLQEHHRKSSIKLCLSMVFFPTIINMGLFHCH